ncbi:hypothetical protein [Paenibacillus sp. 32352]|uniref:hypothetical protein n=1 Tax=Paenibacillus sp. 32352 TaxID=1969111 RepID=UPI0009AE12C8|nr:hypothetical protein [Paenibacillus sp. 32352]
MASPREDLLEKALLQQLHPLIQSTLQSIYQESLSQYDCAHILSINERITSSNQDVKASPVDAIHGQAYFELIVGVRRSGGEYIELTFINDTASGQYDLKTYKQSMAPKELFCPE